MAKGKVTLKCNELHMCYQKNSMLLIVISVHPFVYDDKIVRIEQQNDPSPIMTLEPIPRTSQIEWDEDMIIM